MKEDTGKDILTIEEAAAFLKIGKRSVYKLVKAGEIPGRKIFCLLYTSPSPRDRS